LDALSSWLSAATWAAGQPYVIAPWNDQALQRIAGALIGLACLAISAFLVLCYLRPWHRREVPYCSIVWITAGFLLLCGLSRWLDAIFLGPIRSLVGVVSLLLAAASWTAVLGLAGLVRKSHPPCDPHQFVKELAERRRAEEALRQSEVMARKLALVAGRTENAVIITDREGKIEWVNDAFSRMTGYTLEEVLGRTHVSLLGGPETVAATVDFMEQRIRAGEGFRTEVLNYAKSGRQYWVAVEVQPVHDDQGRFTNFMAVETDISERKHAERRLEAQQVSMQILAGCSRLDEAIPSLLSTIGRSLDFDVVEYWGVNLQSGSLRAAARPWTSQRVGPEWSRAALELEWQPGGGLAGRIWSTGASAWIDDLSADPAGSHPVRELACHSGLRSGFGFPIPASESGPIIGVMTLLSREPLARDEPLLQAMTALGRQIGLFVERRRAQAELVHVNARLNAVLAAATQVSIIATDPDGLITVFNPGAERMLGHSAHEMLGKATPLILHDPREVKAHAAQLSAEYGTRIAGFDALVERARRGGHDVREWTYIRKDGTRLTVLLAVTAVFDPVGRINGFLGIATDLTERQQTEQKLRASEGRFRRLVEANIFGVVFADLDGNITDANDAFLEMVGYTRAEMTAGLLPWDALVPTSAADQLQRCRVELRRKARCAPIELECLRKDGKRLPILLGVALLDEQQPVEPAASVVAFCLDVSERRRLEDELRKHASELAEADVRKNEFLAMLGHELRNPLAPIRNAVKIMKQRGTNDPTLCWARDVIDQQVRQMAHLVDDLLEISRLTRGKVRLQKEVVTVATIVAYAVESSRPIIDRHRHRLSISMPPEPFMVDADPVRMAQVLSNLLNNAAKYTAEGGQIRLVVSPDTEHVYFRVRDNGIGIPAEMLARVFDLFTQIDHSLDRSQGGLGLGLTLVRSLVEMHGGSVRAASEGLGKGSEFTVTLPLWKPGLTSGDDGPAPAFSPARPVIEGARRAFRPRKVLVVDDNFPSAKSLEMLLAIEGHEVQVVHDGPSALQAASLHRHEVVLMDIGLPGMDGYEVARRLRQDPELKDLMLVAITGYAEDEACRRSHAAGFDHHMVKPVDPDAILSLLVSEEWAPGTEPACSSAGSSSDDPRNS
jgi:PAS domain S-box-containing protein